MEGSSVVAGGGGCQYGDFGSLGAQAALLEWVEMCQCHIGGILQPTLQFGSSYTEWLAETSLGRSEQGKKW